MNIVYQFSGDHIAHCDRVLFILLLLISALPVVVHHSFLMILFCGGFWLLGFRLLRFIYQIDPILTKVYFSNVKFKKFYCKG